MNEFDFWSIRAKPGFPKTFVPALHENELIFLPSRQSRLSGKTLPLRIYRFNMAIKIRVDFWKRYTASIAKPS
jgi:hypothetical protein